MNAEFTNAVTNGMHATCLLIYFWAAARSLQRGEGRFTRAVVGFFLLLFVLKMMGVYVHYEPGGAGWAETWVAISLGLVVLHYLLLQALCLPPAWRQAGLVFALVCTALFFLRRDFTFLAVEVLVFNLAAAFYSRGLLRLGFAGVVVSAVVWIVARKVTAALLGSEVPTAYRYDNDLFHFMLIASTFIVYKAFAKGDGVPPGLGEEAVEERGTV